MKHSSDELDRPAPTRSATTGEAHERLIAHIVGTPNEDDPLQLLLLLRSSGDENADRIRRKTLEHYTQRLAANAGWVPDDPTSAPILLKAQIAMATALGIIMLRTSAAVEPIASSGLNELREPLQRIFTTLLTDHEQ